MLSTAARELAANLTGAGLPTALDARNVNPPCAYLAPGRIDYDRMAQGIATVEWELYLLAGDTEPLRAMDDLDALMESLAAVVHPGEAEPMTLNLHNHSPDGLPALLIRITTEISKDE